MKTSWDEVEKWYGGIVGSAGHLYHREVILPALLPLLALKENSSLLDLGCGQGFLSSLIPPSCSYVGVDLSDGLIKQAPKSKRATFLVADATKPLPLGDKKFTHAVFVLSLQNMERPDLAIKNAASHLVEGGTLAMVLNHPCFRIPRQSSWGIDEGKKLQYRRVDSYLSSLKIPIEMQPGKERSATTWSFHFPMSAYMHFLKEAGCAMTDMQEWTSHKKSTGKAAKMENRARDEFPLFLTIVAKKVSVDKVRT